MHSTSFERSKEINLSISIDSRSEIQTKKNFAHPIEKKSLKKITLQTLTIVVIPTMKEMNFMKVNFMKMKEVF